VLDGECYGKANEVVSSEVTFEGVKWWWDSDSSRYNSSRSVERHDIQSV